jgi:signal transduction histidine kinase
VESRAETLGGVISRLRLQMLVVFGVSMALGVVVSFLLSRGITKPIVELARSSKNLANGKLDESLAGSKCTEFQMLADSFRKMQKELQEREDEKSRLESVEITKHLAAGIAHEIKNPINTVGLIVDYLQTNLSPDNPEKRYEFYKLSENMKNELKRINRIVEGFLRLTKPTVYTFNEEDLNVIIRDSVSVLEPEIVKNGVSVRLNLDPALPRLAVDRDKLSQVISNLVINAVEAMPRGGDISITSRLGGGSVEVTVSDNGMGVPSENLRRIFDPYFSTKKQGFGLGLSLAQDIVYKHNGKLSVSSERGKGADFTIQLPMDTKDEQANTRS